MSNSPFDSCKKLILGSIKPLRPFYKRHFNYSSPPDKLFIGESQEGGQGCKMGYIVFDSTTFHTENLLTNLNYGEMSSCCLQSTLAQ